MNHIDNFTTGPGSYNISTDLKGKSLVYMNFPKAQIPKGKKFPDIFISHRHNNEKMCLESPSPNTYNPKTDFVYEKTQIPKFGSSQRIEYFILASKISPGPVYNIQKYISTAISYSKPEKETTFHAT